MNSPIVFYAPSFKVGGTNAVFVRLAREIAANCGRNVILYDYRGGFMDSHVTRSDVGVTVRHVDPKRPVRFRESDGIFVLHLSTLFGVRYGLRIDSGARLVLWSMHPYNLLMSSPLNRVFLRSSPTQVRRVLRLLQPDRVRRVRAFVDSCTARNGLYYMDRENELYAEHVFGATASRRMLPVPVEFADSPVSAQPATRTRPIRKLGWLGRLCGDKIYSLLAALQATEQFYSSRGTRITFCVIGEGDHAHLIDRLRLPHIRLVRCGTLVDEKLASLLVDLDLLIAMGVSCLEGARLGVPSCIPAYSVRPIRPENFTVVPLPDTEGYTLAYHAAEIAPRGAVRLDSVLSQLSDEPPRQLTGASCYNYVKEHHFVDQIARRVLQAADDSSLKMADVEATRVLQGTALEGMATAGLRLRRRVMDTLSADS